VPIKIHIKERPQDFQRFGAQWTPTVMVLDPAGNNRHQFEGFLPADDFIAQLKLGLAHTAFSQQRFEDAERLFRELVDSAPQSEIAPEALYWAGVAKYKRTNDASALGETAAQFTKRYPQSTWAKKASVWAA
jgi:TolA-binding protein